MTRLIDLTQPWGDRMPTWPQFASIEVTDITTHHRDRKSTMLVKTNMHTGTHIDAPSHYCETGKDLGRIPLDDLYGTGLVIDLRPITKPWSFYSLAHNKGCIPPGAAHREGDLVLPHTGWDQYNLQKPPQNPVHYLPPQPPAPASQRVAWAVVHALSVAGRGAVVKSPKTSGGSRLLPAALLALATVAVGYLSVWVADAVFKVDFRFWVVALKLLSGPQAVAFAIRSEEPTS